jgi:hypothetical protein
MTDEAEAHAYYVESMTDDPLTPAERAAYNKARRVGFTAHAGCADLLAIIDRLSAEAGDTP